MIDKIITVNNNFKKAKIPKALKEQVWLTYMGKNFESKCYVKWCNNNINVFDFQTGHNIPESKGGLTILENLRPLCSRCNFSMNNNYTIDEWNKLSNKNKKFSIFCCFKFLSK